MRSRDWRHHVLVRTVSRLGVGLSLTVSASAQPPNQPQSRPDLLPGEVLIEGDLFGVGGAARPGETVGVRLHLTDRGDRVRDAVAALRLRDPDGDTLVVQRPITLNPGRSVPLWLYAPMPPDLDRSAVFAVTVYEAPDEPGGALGEQIAAGAVAPQRVIPIEEAVIAVVGRRGGGLEQYDIRDDTGAPAPTMNEPLSVLLGLEPADLPDRWMGLAALDALVWLDADPTRLTADQADALAHWVRRGGRLIVALPEVGLTWTSTSNPLIGLMPAMVVQRRDGVDLDSLRPLLTTDERLPMPSGATVFVFRPAPLAGPGDADAILTTPAGDAVAIRRQVGLGSVTVLGVNPASPGLAGRVDAQVFWHRLLGSRFDVRSRTELIGDTRRSFPRQSSVRADGGIADLINKTGSAGVGVLLGLIVFAAYFLIAGPVGFGVLSKLGVRRHAWLAFTGVAGLFTVIAWGGATLIKPRITDATHLSFLDGVYGQNDARVRSWFSVLLPTYGSQTVSVGADGGADGAGPDVLWPWREPGAGERAPFPDRRDYAADARRPDTLRVPTRSTVKEFEARWLGPPPWRLPRPTGGTITLDANNTLAGGLVHELPAPLERVVVVLNRGQTPLLRDQPRGGPLLANAWAWSPFGSSPWPAGKPLDLGGLRYRDGEPGANFFESLSRGLRGLGARLEGGVLARDGSGFDAITWFGALTPPDYERIGATTIRRASAHGLDLSPWLTRPCLIVTGVLDGAPSPLPLTVDGRTPPSAGRTLVRWVYPLPPDPPRPAPAGR